MQATANKNNILNKKKLSQALRLAKRHAKDGQIAEAEAIYRDILEVYPQNRPALSGIEALKSNKSGNSSSKKDPELEQVELIGQLYSQGQMERVVFRATNLLEEFPDSAWLHNILGAANFALGELGAAISSYESAIESKPNYADAFNNLGNALAANGSIKKAISNYKQALKLQPENCDALNNLGNALLKKGDVDGAIECYEKALSFKSDFAEARNNLGKAYSDKGVIESALQNYKQAIQLKPNYAEAYNNMGNALADLGSVEEAINCYSKAISILPDYRDAYNNQGRAFEQKGEINSAIKCYETAISLDGDPSESCNLLGVALTSSGNYEYAIQIFERALENDPHNEAVLNNLGNCMKDAGEIHRAIDCYTKAFSLNPEDINSLLNLCDIQLQIQDSKLSTLIESSSLNKNLRARLFGNPKYLITNCISDFVAGNWDRSKVWLSRYEAIQGGETLNSLEPKDRIFCSGYHDFIRQLFTIIPTNAEATRGIIYHIGESHSLSYGYCTVKMRGTSYSIQPQLTLGVKAHHLGQLSNNAFKAITRYNLGKIPKMSPVFVSIGEIDCRADEGIIPASLKLGKDVGQVAQSTVEKYIDWFIRENAAFGHDLYFLNVPAPVYNENRSSDENTQVAKVVELFNASLRNMIQASKLNLVDVYSPTRAENGFSNLQYHCDRFHLDNRILQRIESQLSG